MFSRSASVRRVLGRRCMSFDTMFANKNHIAEKRTKFYSNPTVGTSLPSSSILNTYATLNTYADTY
jgi:hypothetical protein